MTALLARPPRIVALDPRRTFVGGPVRATLIRARGRDVARVSPVAGLTRGIGAGS